MTLRPLPGRRPLVRRSAAALGFAALGGCWLAWLAAGAAHASPTRSFVLDAESSLSEGKLDGTAIESDGTITAGVQTRRVALAGVQTAKSLLELPDGSAFVGTGNEGKIFVVRDGVAKLFADTKQVMVSSLARDAAGTLYAGTLPSGKIFAINAKGELRELASPKGAEHIWALAFDEAHKTLYAATGPEGKVFAIDGRGQAEVYYDGEDAHVMALARAPDGDLYIGTSDRALLLRLRGAGRAEVLYDFPGSEVSAIALRGKRLAVAANQFPKSLKTHKSSSTSGSSGSAGASGAGSNGSSGSSKPSPAPSAPPAGKGQLYYVSAQGETELLFSADEGHIASVAWADDDHIYAGTGKEGHIYRVRVSDHDHALLVDVDERQILTLLADGPAPMFSTADGGAVYDIAPATGTADKREWTSKALDAGARARFGQLYARTRGAISISTRSGNTDKPDTTWSAWSAPHSAPDAARSTRNSSSGAVQSPPARFLQIRVALSEVDSVVYAVEAFYLPDNHPPLVSEVTVDPPHAASPTNDKANKSSNNTTGTQYKLHWKVDNTDDDRLRYRLYARRDGATRYRAILRDSEVLTATEYHWDTEAVPDGYYRVRVQASDELDVPAPATRTARAESEPFLVDNRPPQLTELRLLGARVVGAAFDELGPISRLDYSLDGFEWLPLRADDVLLDSRVEHFTLPLSQLPKGDHILAVRASDARSNSVTREIEVRVP